MRSRATFAGDFLSSQSNPAKGRKVRTMGGLQPVVARPRVNPDCHSRQNTAACSFADLAGWRNLSRVES